MATQKKSNEELRQEVLKEDSNKDVNFNLAVFVAVFAVISSTAAVLAVLTAGFLGNFRKDVENTWLSCMPFCFSFITGVGQAYRKRLADVGIHIALVMTTLLAGGVGYGLSVTPVYLNRHNCTLPPSDPVGDCDKEVLVTIYFFAGAVASGFGALGFLASLCACSNGIKRRARRERIRELILKHEEQKKTQEIKMNKRRLAQSFAEITRHTNQSPPQNTAISNGLGRSDKSIQSSSFVVTESINSEQDNFQNHLQKQSMEKEASSLGEITCTKCGETYYAPTVIPNDENCSTQNSDDISTKSYIESKNDEVPPITKAIKSVNQDTEPNDGKEKEETLSKVMTHL